VPRVSLLLLIDGVAYVLRRAKPGTLAARRWLLRRVHGGDSHSVAERDGAPPHCTCRAQQYRGKCKHVEALTAAGLVGVEHARVRNGKP
jgi:hypothetical protein